VIVHCRVPAALLGRIPEAEAVVRPHARAGSDHDAAAAAIGEPQSAPQ